MHFPVFLCSLKSLDLPRKSVMTTAYGLKTKGDCCSFLRDFFCSRKPVIPLAQGLSNNSGSVFIILGTEQHSFQSRETPHSSPYQCCHNLPGIRINLYCTHRFFVCCLAVRAQSCSDETLKPAQASGLTWFSTDSLVLILSDFAEMLELLCMLFLSE